jgi:hypothetical protein
MEEWRKTSNVLAVVSIGLEAGWTLESVWALRRREKSLAPAGK